MAFATKKTLYLLDCGDFVKIGISKAIRNRFCAFNKTLGEKLDLDKTIIWSLRDGEAEFIEGAIKRKFEGKRIENEISKNEVFSYDTKFLILETVQTVLNALDCEYGVYKATDIFERRPGKDVISIHYLPEIARKIAERTTYPTSFEDRRAEEMELIMK